VPAAAAEAEAAGQAAPFALVMIGIAAVPSYVLGASSTAPLLRPTKG